jgi:hypothetical protein
LNEQIKQRVESAIKTTLIIGAALYEKAFEEGIRLYDTKTAKAIRQFVGFLYYLLATRMDELEALANKRYIEQWHKTILCTCRRCDPQYLWKTKGFRELKKSWM